MNTYWTRHFINATVSYWTQHFINSTADTSAWVWVVAILILVGFVGFITWVIKDTWIG